MDNKKETKEERVRELEDRLIKIDKDLSDSYSIGKKIARTKIQEELDNAKSNLYFHN